VVEHRIPAERHRRIHFLLEERGIIGVAELSSLLGVSEITIRRDLLALERRGLLERARGGAVATHRLRVETLFSQKGLDCRAEKEAIGRAAAELIEDGDTLLVNGGSTTLEVVRHLGNKRVQLITNNVAAAVESQALGIELILIGGEYRSQSNSVVGGFSTIALQRVYASKAILGVDGLSARDGLTHPVAQEAEVTAHMIERTRGEVIIVADHRKLAVVSNFVSAPIDEVAVLVTDALSRLEYRNELEQKGIRIIIALEEAG
jgi:DeoR family fructose operon transcriptional repressor